MIELVAFQQSKSVKLSIRNANRVNRTACVQLCLHRPVQLLSQLWTFRIQLLSMPDQTEGIGELEHEHARISEALSHPASNPSC